MSYINILQFIVIIILIFLIINKKENFSPSQVVEIKRIKDFIDMHKSGTLKVKNLKVTGKIVDDLIFSGINHNKNLSLDGHKDAIVVDNLKCNNLFCNSLFINNQNKNNNADRHSTRINPNPNYHSWWPGTAIGGTTYIYNGKGPDEPDNRFKNKIKYGTNVWGNN